MDKPTLVVVTRRGTLSYYGAAQQFTRTHYDRRSPARHVEEALAQAKRDGMLRDQVLAVADVK